jgi:hypothetical protein
MGLAHSSHITALDGCFDNVAQGMAQDVHSFPSLSCADSKTLVLASRKGDSYGVNNLFHGMDHVSKLLLEVFTARGRRRD